MKKIIFVFCVVLFAFSTSFAFANSVVWTAAQGYSAHGVQNFTINSPADILTPGQQFKVTGTVSVYTCTNTPANVHMEWGEINSQNYTYSSDTKNTAGQHDVGFHDTAIVLGRNGGYFTAPTAAGTYRIYIYEKVNEGYATDGYFTASGYIEFKIESVPPPVVSLVANPQTVYKGNSSVLTWSATNANSCSQTVVTSGIYADSTWNKTGQAVSGSQTTKTYTDVGTYTYKIACTGSGGTTYSIDSITVVLPPSATPTVTLTASPVSIDAFGSRSNLTWSSQSADSCEQIMLTSDSLNDATWSGSGKAVSGSQATKAFLANGTYIYKIKCTGSGGSAEATASVVVNAPPPATTPSVTLTASPVSVRKGSSSSITWSTVNVKSCTQSMVTTGILDDSTWVNINTLNAGTQNTKTYTDVGTYTYKIVCTSINGSASATIDISVFDGDPPTVSISANPTELEIGNSSTITWSSTHANTCVQSMVTTGTLGDSTWTGTSKPTSGSQATKSYTSAGTYTYKITCTGSGGTTSGTVNVVAKLPTVSASLGATPVLVQKNNTSTLTWSSANATSCKQTMVTNGVLDDVTWNKINQAVSGSQTTKSYTSAGIYTYKIECTGIYGTASATASVTVQGNYPQVTLLANSPITVGSSTKLIWSSTNATSCKQTMLTLGNLSDSYWNKINQAVSGSQDSEVYDVNNIGIHTYSIECNGEDGSGSAIANVVVKPVAPDELSVNLWADPNPIPSGTGPKLYWSTTGAPVSCSGTRPLGTEWTQTPITGKDVRGSSQQLVNPISATTTYEILCNDVDGNIATSSTEVDIIPPLVCGNKVEVCDAWGECDVAINSQTVNCHYEENPTNPVGCPAVDPDEHQKTQSPCFPTVAMGLVCIAQHGTQDLGKVFIGKQMKWVVSGVDIGGLYLIDYKLDPPNYNNKVTMNLTTAGFSVPYTYYEGGDKRFDVTITMFDGAKIHIGKCTNATTTAVIYDGTEIEI